MQQTRASNSAHRQSEGGKQKLQRFVPYMLRYDTLAHNPDALWSDEAEQGLIEQPHTHTQTRTHTQTYDIPKSEEFKPWSHYVYIQHGCGCNVSSCIYRSIPHPGVPHLTQSVVTKLFICCLCLWFSCSAAAQDTLQPIYKIFWLAEEPGDRSKAISRVSPEFI